MNNRPTPETDAEAMDGQYRSDMGCVITLSPWEYKKDPCGEVVSVEFARRLERALAEAREVASGLAKQAERLRKERDEARYGLQENSKINKITMNNTQLKEIREFAYGMSVANLNPEDVEDYMAIASACARMESRMAAQRAIFNLEETKEIEK